MHFNADITEQLIFPTKKNIPLHDPLKLRNDEIDFLNLTCFVHFYSFVELFAGSFCHYLFPFILGLPYP